MKRGVLFLSALLMGVGVVSAKEMRLFLLIGQSNMAGRGVVRGQDRKTHPQIFMMDRKNQWAPARDPVHFDKSMAGVGLCSSFARKDAELHPDDTVGLIPCALGGSGLNQWMPGERLYTNAVYRASLAKKDGRLVGILWHQGESDSDHFSTTISYTTRFRDFIKQLRTDLDAEDVPVVVGEFGSFFPPAPMMNKVMRRAAAQTPLCGCASAKGLTHKGDYLHFCSESLGILGERYHEVFRSLEKAPRLRNCGLEREKGKQASSWQNYGNFPYVIETENPHSGKYSVRCDAPTFGTSGIKQEIVYDKPDKRPLVFGGWSRSKNAHAGEYCIYLDIWYEGGGNEWGLRAVWNPGTHDWEKNCEIFYPRKPIKKIQMFAFLRKGTGTVWFDDLFLERRDVGLEVISVQRLTDRPHTSRDHVTVKFPKKLTCWVIGGLCRGGGSEISFSVDSNQTLVKLFLSDWEDGAEVSIPLKKLDSVPCNHLRADSVRVWTADSMRRITPLTFPTADEVKAPEIRLEMAGRERESAQIQISTGLKKELKNVTLSLPALKNEKGEAFPGNLKWERVGYIARRAGYYRHPFAPDDGEKWLPDPLLPAAPFRVRKGATQGVWLTACAEPGAKPGVYRGDVFLSADGKRFAKIPLAIRMRNFSQPQTFGMPTAFCVMDGFTRAHYPDRYQQMRKRSHEIMLDYRLNPDDISRTTPPPIEDLLVARDRGMNRFNILNLVVPPQNKNARWVCTSTTEQLFNPAFYDYVKKTLTPYVAELRKHGLQKYAYIYGFDERRSEFYQGIDKIWKNLKKDFPEIPLMTTAMMYRDMAVGDTNYPCLNTSDWYCPLTSVFKPELTEKLHARGKQVWWYVCCAPLYPYANFASIEYSPIEGRLLGWMTHQYRADGLLYWHVNFWGNNPLMDERDTYLTSWNSYSALHMPGDGILLYPGKHGILPSIRLAQIRDGVEDYEWLQMAAAKKGSAAADACGKKLIQNMKEYSRSPEDLKKVRSELADLIE